MPRSQVSRRALLLGTMGGAAAAAVAARTTFGPLAPAAADTATAAGTLPQLDPGELRESAFGIAEHGPRLQVSRDPGFEDPQQWYPDDVIGTNVAELVPDGGRGGGSAGRITVLPDMELSWPTLANDVRGLLPGSMVMLSAWLRPEGVTDGQGGYISLSYYAEDGSRISYDQSTGVKGTGDWLQLTVFGAVPEGTARVSMRMNLYGRGICYFDDATLMLIQTGDSTALLENGDFGAGGEGWRPEKVRRGPCRHRGSKQHQTTATVVREAGRTGAAAQIVVPECQRVGVPSLTHGTAAVVPGSQTMLRGWVRTADVVDGDGAYLQVSFRDKRGREISTAQTAAVLGSQDWTELSVPVVVPERARKARVCVVLNGRGTATFDDLTFEVLGSSTPEHATSADLSVGNVVSAAVGGIAVENNPFLFREGGGMTPEYTQELVDRLTYLAPSRVRVFMARDWFEIADGEYDFSDDMMGALAQTLHTYGDLGIDAVLTFVDWSGVSWTPDQHQRLVNLMVAALGWLREQQSVTNVSDVMVFNEADLTYPGTPSEFGDLVRLMRAGLDDAGFADVAIFGVDSASSTAPLYAAATQDLGDVADEVGFHAYPQYAQPLGGALLSAKSAIDLALEAGMTPGLWEANIHGINGGTYSPGTSQDGTLLPRRFATTLTFVAYALQQFAQGVDTVSYWEVIDMYYGPAVGNPDFYMQLGIWGNPLDGMEIRPMHYGLTMLSRVIRPGSQVRTVEVSAPGSLIALAVDNPDGTRAVVVLNPWEADTEVTVPVQGASVSRVHLTQDSVAAALAAEAIELPQEDLTVIGGSITETLPACSVYAYVS